MLPPWALLICRHAQLWAQVVQQRNPQLLERACPYTGEKLIAVRAIEPDVAIIYMPRADESGNCHLWGNLGVTMPYRTGSGAAMAGYAVRLYDIHQAILDQAVKRIEANLQSGVERGKVSEAEKASSFLDSTHH
jgi:hypothetical protein